MATAAHATALTRASAPSGSPFDRHLDDATPPLTRARFGIVGLAFCRHLNDTTPPLTRARFGNGY
jgi:hypothetical protein